MSIAWSTSCHQVNLLTAALLQRVTSMAWSFLPTLRTARQLGVRKGSGLYYLIDLGLHMALAAVGIAVLWTPLIMVALILHSEKPLRFVVY